MGSDLRIMRKSVRLCQFQSTLPYGERPNSALKLFRYNSFNPRSRMGSDEARDAPALRIGRFNPRSRMGSDGDPRRRNSRVCSFNPRSRMGSDDFMRLFCENIIVSIHAPVWGATQKLATRGCAMAFQSTLPYGERQQSRTIFLPFSVIVYAIITILLY